MTSETTYESIGTCTAELPHALVGELAGTLPDVAAKKDQIGDTLASLVKKYDLETYLGDPATTLVLTGMAAKLVTASEIGVNEFNSQADVTDIALGLLTGKTEPYDDVMSDDEEMLVYMRYENKALSAQLKQRIDDGLLDDVKQRMGVTDENESPYQVHVLDIATSSALSGITWGYHRPGDDRDVSVAVKQDKIERELVSDYISGLLANKDVMCQGLGIEQPHGAAWVSFKDGAPHMFIMNPDAEKILNPEVTNNSSSYGEGDQLEVLALLGHEYGHTQGTLTLNGTIAFGIGLEELRVEHFSGNKRGYYDIKRFFKDLDMHAGLDVCAIFDARPKGGTPHEVYYDIAAEVGIESMLDIVMTAPYGYCTRSGGMKDISEALSGREEIIDAIIEQKGIAPARNLSMPSLRSLIAANDDAIDAITKSMSQ